MISFEKELVKIRNIVRNKSFSEIEQYFEKNKILEGKLSSYMTEEVFKKFHVSRWNFLALLYPELCEVSELSKKSKRKKDITIYYGGPYDYLKKESLFIRDEMFQHMIGVITIEQDKVKFRIQNLSNYKEY